MYDDASPTDDWRSCLFRSGTSSRPTLRSGLAQYVTVSLLLQLCPLTCAYIQLNEALGGDSDHLYLIVNDFGSASGLGLDFINGMSFLERFYMVYDVGNSRAGLATTQYTYAEIN